MSHPPRSPMPARYTSTRHRGSLLITRLESCTNEAVQVAPSPHARARESESRGVRTHAARDVTLGLCTFAYLAVVLFDDVESPLLSIVLIALVAYALIQPRSEERRVG